MKPIAPTNEPKMPEVIYAHADPDTFDDGVWNETSGANTLEVYYTRTDKVGELKEALRECVKHLDGYTKILRDNCYIESAKDTDRLIAKASNLLK